jgi:hypothetical protein
MNKCAYEIQAEATTEVFQIAELDQSELALVGGGIGDVVFS